MKRLAFLLFASFLVRCDCSGNGISGEAICGDGTVQKGEACDQGAANADESDACRTYCALPICGDGIIDPPFEFCDDGNTLPGDGCDADCAIELAVEYGSFFAREVPVGVVVEWTTVNELHTAGFKVWAINVDNTIEQIGFVFATGPHSHYAHMDDSAKAKAGLRRGYQVVEVTFEGDQGDATPWFKITR